MNRTIHIAAMCLLLSGCGEMAYKMGGGTEQYNADKKSCMPDGDEAAYKACMKGKGWTVMGLESLRPAPPALQPAHVTTAPAPHSDSAPTPSAATTPATTPTAVTDKSMPAAVAAPSTSPPTATASPLDPNERVIVNSWWKFGATDFKGDTAACTAQLGPEHTYDETNHVTTRAFAACMRTKKWYAY